ncbi:MAG: hypothetical protein Fur003_1070 [Candidatus Dojkabacteria bacterium]
MINKSPKNKIQPNKEIRNTTKGSSSDATDKQFFIDTVARFCDKCGTSYTINDVRIVKDTNFSSIIHFSCPNCKSNHIATFVKPMGMTSRVPINSDLQVDEITQFAQREGISSDEVLDLYNLLESSEKASL